MGHYSVQFNNLRKQETADNRRKLHQIIEKSNGEDIKYLLKVAQNLQGYKNFEKFVANIISGNNFGGV